MSATRHASRTRVGLAIASTATSAVARKTGYANGSLSRFVVNAASGTSSDNSATTSAPREVTPTRRASAYAGNAAAENQIEPQARSIR